MNTRILKLAISTELDVVAARQRAREIAVQCSFPMQDQVRIATSVSELVRNVYNYAHGGKVEFLIDESNNVQVLQIRIDDQGPGFAHLEEVLAGRYVSPTGMGLGILGAKRLMDHFELETAPGKGTKIVMHKNLPSSAARLTARMVGEMGAGLAALMPESMLAEVQQQNRELLGTLAELKMRQEEQMRLTAELEETNRGVMALYAELDDRAARVVHADAMKSRFLSNMSHEFRTPLSSIRALSKLLLSGADGELSTEQEKQVTFILQGTIALNDMVDDLLDLAKIEAGKVDVKVARFEVADMFGSLRGMLRPLLVNPDLVLVFHEPAPGLALDSDQGKLSQILRNFISNAIKFTERGAIDVRVAADAASGMAAFTVTDTGLGIEPRHLPLVFEEFSQIENHLQTRAKGTGLGLPLCRKLAELLNGEVSARSVPGAGSVFTVSIPLFHATTKDGSAGLPAVPPTN